MKIWLSWWLQAGTEQTEIFLKIRTLQFIGTTKKVFTISEKLGRYTNIGKLGGRYTANQITVVTIKSE